MFQGYVNGYQYPGRKSADHHKPAQRCAAMLASNLHARRVKSNQPLLISRPTGPLLQLCLFSQLLRFCLFSICRCSLRISFCFLPLLLLFFLLIFLFFLFLFFVLLLFSFLFFFPLLLIFLFLSPRLLFFPQSLFCFLPLLRVRVPLMSGCKLASIYRR
jgi:hypothetical protein